MRIVITGAGGFLGKNLVKSIHGDKVDFVRLLDIHGQDTSANSSFNSDSHALDLVSSRLSELIEEGDVVIHLAWRSNPSVTGSNVEAELGLNWWPSKNVIEVCTEKKAKLIFISSGGTVYGKTIYSSIDENHPLSPISAYGKVKLKVEEEIIKTGRENSLKYVILRPSNLYGPGFNTEKGLGVIGHWVQRIKENQPFQIVGNGEQVRDFIHVDDLSTAILASLELENEILNTGTGIGISLNQLITIFEEVVGRKIEVNYLDGRDFDVTNNVLSIEKIKQKTGWSPRVSLKSGIHSLIQAD